MCYLSWTIFQLQNFGLFNRGFNKITPIQDDQPYLFPFSPYFPHIFPTLFPARRGEWDEAVLPLYGFERHEDVLDAVDTTPQMLRALAVPTVFLGAANETRRCGGILMW